jgi:hypothetical protein
MIVAAVMVAAAGVLAGSVQAQTGSAGCDSALRIVVPDSLVAYDRFMPVTVERGDRRQVQRVRRVHVELRDSATSERFYAADLTAAEIRALIAGGADGPVTYLMSAPQGEGPSYAHLSWSGVDGCRGERRTADVTAAAPRGASRYRASLTRAGREGRVSLGGGSRGCLLSVAKPVRVTVRAAGRSRTVHLDHSCGDWETDRPSLTLPGVTVTLTDGNYRSAALLGLRARRSAGRRRTVTVTVSEGNRRVLNARFALSWRAGAAAGRQSVRLLERR